MDVRRPLQDTLVDLTDKAFSFFTMELFRSVLYFFLLGPEGTIVLEIYGQMYFIYFLSFMKLMNEILTVFKKKCIIFYPLFI